MQLVPDAIHKCRSETRFVTLGHQPGQFTPAAGGLTRVNSRTTELRIGDAHQSVTCFKIDGPFRIASRQFNSGDDHLAGRRVVFLVPHHDSLLKEAVEGPELFLFRIVEGMIVALGTLQLRPQKQPRRDARRGDGSVVQMGHQKIHRPVLIRPAFSRHQVKNRLMPGPVELEVVAEKLRQSRPIDLGPRGPADQQIGPDRREMTSILGAVEQPVDFYCPLRPTAVSQKPLDIFDRRDMSYQIKMHPAQPFRVVGPRGRGNPRLTPPRLQLFIHKRNDCRRRCQTGPGRRGLGANGNKRGACRGNGSQIRRCHRDGVGFSNRDRWLRGKLHVIGTEFVVAAISDLRRDFHRFCFQRSRRQCDGWLRHSDLRGPGRAIPNPDPDPQQQARSNCRTNAS